MGYRCYFNLEVENDPGDEIIKKFRDECENAKYCLTDDGYSNNDSSWYDVDKDLKKLSKNYPDRLFTMWIEGPVSDDLRKLYVKDGKAQEVTAEITYPEFDPEKLVE